MSAVVDDVVAQAEFLVDHGGERLDAVGVDRGELLDPAEDIVEFGHQRINFGIAHGDAGELGDVAHLFCVYGHEGRLAGAPPPFKRAIRRARQRLAVDDQDAALDVRSSTLAVARSGAGAGLAAGGVGAAPSTSHLPLASRTSVTVSIGSLAISARRRSCGRGPP